MKAILRLLLFALLLAACQRKEPDTSTSRNSARKDSDKHVNGVTLTYSSPSSTTQAPGHQAYRFGEKWASSREEIIQEMARAGWTLHPGGASDGAKIRFYNDAKVMPPMPDAIRWEED